MKIQTFISLASAAVVASSASAALSNPQVYSSFATWSAAAGAVITGAGSGAVYGSDWSGGYAPTAGPTVQFGGGWQTMNAWSSGPALNQPGYSSGTIEVKPSVAVGTIPASVQQVTFDFLAYDYSAPYAPTGTNGFYAFGINYLGANGANATDSIAVYINGSNTGQFALVSAGNGFMGVTVNFGGDRIDTVTFVFNSKQGVTVTGAAFAAVPAPGAFALLGVAGLLGSRRRR